jgi:hypothetical protein
MNDDQVCLYILMRNDLASLNAGKAVAQGSHAANQCIYEIRNLPVEDFSYLHSLANMWESETRAGFGTCIVLEAKFKDILRVVGNVNLNFSSHSNQKVIAGIVHDPSYPLMDGETLHLIPLETCAFVFGERKYIRLFLSDLPLMK